MSEAETPTRRKHLSEYTGERRYVGWIEDYLGFDLTPEQMKIVQSVLHNRKTLVVGANGFGKTVASAAISLAWMFRNHPATALATSGTFQKMKRTYCANVQSLYEYANQYGLPGRFLESEQAIRFRNNPRIFWEAAKPKDAGELEGAHNVYTLSLIEEADKDGVTDEVFDSMESLLTDRRDRMLVIANPPVDETNNVADAIDDPTWNVLEFSSFQSHNVLVEIGEREGEMVEGLVTLPEIRENWATWNGEEWPGVEVARNSGNPDSDYYRDDLDVRWYRRRLGVMPPSTASTNRPIEVADVKRAYDGYPTTVTEAPQGLGLDVARGSGDYNVLSGAFGDELRVIERWHGDNHVHNESVVRNALGETWNAPLMVDAVGEGSALADNIAMFYPHTVRFNAGSNPVHKKRYHNCWSEGLQLLGNFLEAGGTINNTYLREELLSAANVVEFRDKWIASRSATVQTATSKKEITKHIGRSPDTLDSAYQACYAIMWDREAGVEESWAW